MKKLVKSILFLSLGIGLLSSCVVNRSAQSSETPRTITVTGTGSVDVKPDLIYLRFLVKTMDWNVSKAAEKNATNTNNVLTALINAGIPTSDISTFDYSITQDNSNNYPGQYTAKNTIAVVIRNIDMASSVIDAAVKINTGANGITSFKYGISDESSALRQARTLAISDAQNAASLLAGASACKLSSVQNINEYHSTGNSDMSLKLMSLEDSTPILAGTMTVTSNVTVTYILEN